MDISTYLGQLMSPVFVIIGLALLIRPDYYTKAYKSWIKNEGLMLFTAMVAIPAGVAVLLAHNVWVLSWEVLITIAGWGMIIKGVFMSLLPRAFDKLAERLMKIKWLLAVGGLIWLIGGLYLGYNVWFV